MIAVSAGAISTDAAAVPYVNADEAYRLLVTALERFLTLVENLSAEDWNRPTACTQWSVRDMLAHQAGGYANGASLRELIHQMSSLPKNGQLPEDAMNAAQLRDRAGRGPAELLDELRRVGPVAARRWAYDYALLKLVSIPHPVAGNFSLRHLMWVTHSRDTWMHRLDICRATGRPFEQTAEHDGRIAALVMRDVAEALARKASPSLVFELTGIAGGTWKIGQGEPAAAIRMDVLEFNIFASGRYTFDQARPLMEITGDVNAAEQALRQLLIIY